MSDSLKEKPVFTYKEAFKIYAGITPSDEETRGEATNFLREVSRKESSMTNEIFGVFADSSLPQEEFDKKIAAILKKYGER